MKCCLLCLGPVSVRDIVWLLRSQLHVMECQLYGYLTSEEDMAIIIVSTSQTPSKLQVRGNHMHQNTVRFSCSPTKADFLYREKQWSILFLW